jgi:hypothetical protein
MASYAAVSVVANTIRGVLANSRPPDQFTGAEFKLLRTQDFKAASAQITYGVSIYLHRIAFNTNRRSQPPRVTLEGKRYRPPTAVDLHFLVTAWGRTADEEMDILAWAIRTLQDTTELAAGLLNRFSGERPEQVFADSEAVELVGEILTPQQPSISYVARQVLIDSETELPDVAAVQTRGFDYVKLISNASPLTARS